MIAFHGSPEIKERYLTRVQAHAKNGEISKNTYWENGKGCAVGCTIHSSDYLIYEKELGIPRQVIGLEESIFNELPLEKAKLWPERFLDAVKPGADLSKVFPLFTIWILSDPNFGVNQFTGAAGRKIIKTICALYKKCLDSDGDYPKETEWEEAIEVTRAALQAEQGMISMSHKAINAAKTAAELGPGLATGEETETMKRPWKLLVWRSLGAWWSASNQEFVGIITEKYADKLIEILISRDPGAMKTRTGKVG